MSGFWPHNGQGRSFPHPPCDTQPCPHPRTRVIMAEADVLWQPHRRPTKSRTLKILTSKLFDIKILPTLFPNPAPRKTFRRYGGGGVPPIHAVFPIRRRRRESLFQREIHRRNRRRCVPGGNRFPIPRTKRMIQPLTHPHKGDNNEKALWARRFRAVARPCVVRPGTLHRRP